MHPLGKEEITFRQRVLACSGFDPKGIDGVWGAKTQAAEDAFEAGAAALKADIGTFDSRSEGIIATLLLPAQRKAREFMKRAAGFSGVTVKLLSGTRTYAEQDRLYRQRPKVTNARGGQSNHNFGIAWDVGLFKGGKYLTGASKAEEQEYIDLAKFVLPHVSGLEWGGNWKSIVDRPHYQLATGKALSAVRKSFEAGHPFV